MAIRCIIVYIITIARICECVRFEKDMNVRNF